MKRVIFDVLMFLSVFILPWWITAILALVGIFLFKKFYEFLVVSAIVYALFAIPSTRFIASPFWYPLTIGIIYIGVQFLRRHIILYKNEI